jgi:RHS repeat-associated protein
LLDASGTATDWYELDTFGGQVSSSGTTPNPYRFGAAWGYITDPSGFLQLGERYYWPEVGRFIQQDPIGDGANWYQYVGGDPLVAADPEGLDPCCPAPPKPKPCEHKYKKAAQECHKKYDPSWGELKRDVTWRNGVKGGLGGAALGGAMGGVPGVCAGAAAGAAGVPVGAGLWQAGKGILLAACLANAWLDKESCESGFGKYPPIGHPAANLIRRMGKH